MQVPQSKPSAAAPAPAPLPRGSIEQQWLGTVVTVADASADEIASTDYAISKTGAWLLENGWRYGFVPVLPEAPAAGTLGYTPWTLS